MSRRVSDEPRVDPIMLEFRDTERFEAYVRECRQRRRRRQRKLILVKAIFVCFAVFAHQHYHP